MQRVIFGTLIFLFSVYPALLAGKNPGYLVLLKKVDVSVKSEKLSSRTELLLQINSREGEEAAEFELEYSPTRKLKGLSAWIQDTTGNIIRKLEKKNITTRSELYGNFYSDYMVKRFELKHNRYPYQVHVEYEYETSEFLSIANWSPIYDSDAPTLNSTLTVEVPLKYPVRILQQKIPAPAVDTLEGTIRYQWTGVYMHLLKKETGMPPIQDLCPFVSVVPMEFEYGIKGSFASWRSFGDYVDGLMKGLDVLPASESVRIAQLTSGLTDTLEMIRAVFHYLQDNTRYINVSVDIGGMKPYPAGYVAQNKYGDCKALTLFMKSLLASIGIRSYYTLVTGAVMPGKINTDFPAQQFNHAILCLPYHSDTLWLDCTSKEQPVGYTSAFIQGRPALVIAAGNSKLVNIPVHKPSEVVVSNTYHCSGFPDGTMDVTVRSGYQGIEFERIADYVESSDLGKQKKLVEDLLPFKNFTIENYKFARQSADECKIELNAKIKVRDLMQSLESKTIISPPSCGFPVFENVQTRQNPVFFPSPVNNSDTIVLTIPAGMLVKSSPSVELSCESGTFKVSSSFEGNNLVYIRNILIRSGHLSLEQYPAFYTWIGAISTFERQNKIILYPTHE